MVLYGILQRWSEPASRRTAGDPSPSAAGQPRLRLAAILALVPLAAIGCGQREAAPLRLATTTSVRDSGLLDALLPAFRERYGFDVGFTAVGTGLALRLAERGEVDAVITHDQAKEEAFIRAGHARGRRVFASSEFVIVGPPSDPAGIAGLDADAAFARLASDSASFASRGDSSGTHSRELSLWKAAGGARPPAPGYIEVRAGMQTTLQYASDKDAYTLTDRATYLAHRDGLELEVLVQGDPLLENRYAVMVIDPGKHPKADRRRAGIFADWLFSDEAREIITGLRRGGEPLFRGVRHAAGARGGGDRLVSRLGARPAASPGALVALMALAAAPARTQDPPAPAPQPAADLEESVLTRLQLSF